MDRREIRGSKLAFFSSVNLDHGANIVLRGLRGRAVVPPGYVAATNRWA